MWIIQRDDSEVLCHKGVKGMRKGFRKDGKPSTWNPGTPVDPEPSAAQRKWAVRRPAEDEDDEKEKYKKAANQRSERARSTVSKHASRKASEASKSPSRSRGASAVNRILGR